MTRSKVPPSPKARLKSLTKWGGRALLVVSIGFLAFEINRNWAAASDWRPSARDTLTVLVSAIIYALALFLIVEAWHQVVGLFADEPRRRTYPSFAITQIAKYLPGNVAHLFGRGFYLHGGNLSAGQIVTATLTEMLLIPAAALACIVGAGVLGVKTLQFGWLPAFFWPLTFGAASLTAALAAVFAIRLHYLRPAQIYRLAGASALATAFILALGSLYFATFNLVGSANAGDLVIAAIAAWLVGFLTPGAPGGLGTREATLVLLLSHLGQEEAVLLSAALFRIVTVLGDCLLFAAGWIANQYIARTS